MPARDFAEASRQAKNARVPHMSAMPASRRPDAGASLESLTMARSRSPVLHPGAGSAREVALNNVAPADIRTRRGAQPDECATPIHRKL